jgi:Do/DeqQ family serine protease
MLRASCWIRPLVLAVLVAAAAPASAGIAPPVPTLAPMLEKVMPAVVSIAVHGRMAAQRNPLFQDPFFRQFFGEEEMPRYREFQAMGSGVIVDAARGYILTNNHVVDRADRIVVGLSDGRQVPGQVVGSDSETDVAVVQVQADRLSQIAIGNSDQLRVGDYVVAVGNPFGLQQTVTSGIVSALGRKGLGIEGYENFIQTDASINPGNSGGALIDLTGRLIGINTAIVGPSGANVGIGFAIPINTARQVMQQLLVHGKVRRGQLGAVTQDLTPDLAEALGAPDGNGIVVARVVPRSAAALAGLKRGDVVIAVNGEAIRSLADFKNVLSFLPEGASVQMTVLRQGRQREMIAKLAAPES